MTIIVCFYTELNQTVLNSWFVKAMGVSRRGNGYFPPWKIGAKNQNFLENLTSAAQFRLIDLFLAMTVYLPVSSEISDLRNS